MEKILIIVGIIVLYAILVGISYAILKKLGTPEGIKEAFALFFPLGIPILAFAFIVYCTYKLIYKLFKWE